MRREAAFSRVAFRNERVIAVLEASTGATGGESVSSMPVRVTAGLAQGCRTGGAADERRASASGARVLWEKTS